MAAAAPVAPASGYAPPEETPESAGYPAPLETSAPPAPGVQIAAVPPAPGPPFPVPAAPSPSPAAPSRPPSAAELQPLYDEVSRRGLLRQPGTELEQLAHELRARGLVHDPTQGGLVPAVRQLPAPGSQPPASEPKPGAGSRQPGAASPPVPRAAGGAVPVLPQVPGTFQNPALTYPRHGSVSPVATPPTPAAIQRTVSAIVPPIRPLSEGRTPAEDAFARADFAWRQRPTGTGALRAEEGAAPGTGPLARLSRSRDESFANLYPSFATRREQLASDLAQIVSESGQLQAAASLDREGLLSPREHLLLQRRIQELDAKSKQHDERAAAFNRQLQGWGQWAKSLQGRPLHPGPFYPEEVARGENQPSLAQRVIDGALRLVGIAEPTPEIRKAEALLQMTGRYPPLPPNPGKTPAERQRYADEKNAVIRFVADELRAGETPRPVSPNDPAERMRRYPPGSLAYEEAKAELERGKAQPRSAVVIPPSSDLPLSVRYQHFDPWQKQLLPVVRQQLQAMQEARRMSHADVIQLAELAGLLAGGKAGGFVGGRVFEALEPFVGRAGEAGVSRSLSRFSAQRFVRQGLATAGAGLAAGGVAAPVATATTGALLGVPPKETAKAAAGSILPGAAFGTVAAGVLWGIKTGLPELLSTHYDPVRTPEAIAAFTAGTQREYGLTDERAAEIRTRLEQIARAPAPQKGRLIAGLLQHVQNIEEEFRAARAQPITPAGRPAPPEAAGVPPPREAPVRTTPPRPVPPEPEPGPTIVAPDGRVVSLRHLDPEALAELKSEHDQMRASGQMTPRQAAHAARLEAWLALNDAYQRQIHPALPPEQVPAWQQEWSRAENPARAQHDQLAAAAERVQQHPQAGTRPELAAKLRGAAEQVRRDAARAFSESTLSGDALAQLPPAVPPPQVSVYRTLTREQLAQLTPQERRALLTQDVSNSQQVLSPESHGIFQPRSLPGGSPRSDTALKARADELFTAAQRHLAAVQPTEPAAEIAAAPAAPAAPAAAPAAAAPPAAPPAPARAATRAPRAAPAAPSAAAGGEEAAPAAVPGSMVPPGVIPVPAGGGGGAAPAAPLLGPVTRASLKRGARLVLRDGRQVRIEGAAPGGKLVVVDELTGVRETVPATDLLSGSLIAEGEGEPLAQAGAPPPPRPSPLAEPAPRPAPAAAAESRPQAGDRLRHRTSGLEIEVVTPRADGGARVRTRAGQSFDVTPKALSEMYEPVRETQPVAPAAPTAKPSPAAAPSSAPAKWDSPLKRGGKSLKPEVEAALKQVRSDWYAGRFPSREGLAFGPQLAAELDKLERSAKGDLITAKATIDAANAIGRAAQEGRLLPAEEAMEQVAPGWMEAGRERLRARLEAEKAAEASAAAPAAPEPELGDGTRFKAADRELAGQWAVLPLAAVIPSHTDTLQPNPAYPAALQPRERGRIASAEQVADMAAHLDPELLGENPLAQHGAPILGPDRFVESGNARVLAIRRAYQTGKAGAYRDWLTQNAARFGLDPAAVGKVEQPVLVRLRTTPLSHEERLAFTRSANARETAQMAASEQAKVDAANLTPELMNLFKPGEDGNLNVAGNMPFVKGFIEALPVAERGSLRQRDGRLSQEGVRRVAAAVFQHAYGDSRALERLTESTEGGVRNMLAGLMRAAPQVAAFAREQAKGTRHALSIGPDLARAVAQIADLRDQQFPVADWLKQGELFGEDPLLKAMVGALDTFKRSAKKVGALVTEYLDLAEKAGDPSTSALPGFEEITPPSKLEVWEAAAKRVGALPDEQGELGLAPASGYPAGRGEGPAGGGGGAGAAAPGTAHGEAAAGVGPGAAGRAAGGGTAGTEVSRTTPPGFRRGSVSFGREPEGNTGPGGKPVFADPQLEAWRKENYQAPPEPPRESVLTRLGHQATRPIEALPRTPFFEPLLNALLRFQKLPQIARTEAMIELAQVARHLSPRELAAEPLRGLPRSPGQLTPPEMALFSGALVTRDMAEDVAKGIPLAPPWTEEKVKAELAHVNQQLRDHPRIEAALARRQEMVPRIANAWRQSLLDIGARAPELDREDWYHHQVMNRMEEVLALRRARGLKATLRPGWTLEREGGVPYSTDYLTAEFSVIADMIKKTEENKILRLVQERYDIRPQLRAAAMIASEPKLSGFFRDLAAARPADRAGLVESLPAPLGKMAVEGRLPDLANGKYEAVLDEIAGNFALNQSRTAAGIGGPAVPVNPEMLEPLAEYAKAVLGWLPRTPTKPGVTPGEIPPGYGRYRITEHNPLYRAYSLPAKLAQAIEQSAEGALAVKATELRRVAALGRAPEMVLPLPVIAALQELQPAKPALIDTLVRRVAGGAKLASVLSPPHLPTLMREKLFGDAVRVVRGNPGVLAELPAAVRDIWATRVRKEPPSGEYRAWLREGGTRGWLSGMTAASEDRGLNLLGRLAVRRPSVFQQAPERALALLRMAPDRLDEVVRYAAFRSFGKQIDQHGRPTRFGAARPDLVLALPTRNAQAYALSNNLMGSYDENTVLGKALRDHLPLAYVGFFEAQARAEWRLMANAWNAPAYRIAAGRRLIGEALGQKTAVGITRAWSMAAWALPALLIGGSLYAYDRWRFPNEEQEMDDPRLHFDLGHGPDGTMLVWPRVGLLPGPLSVFGLDDPFSFAPLYLNGQWSFQDVARFMGQSGEQTFLGLAAGAPAPVELFTGRRFVTGGPISDRLEYVADKFHVGMLYRAARGIPQAGGLAGQLEAAGLGGRLLDPAEMSYREMTSRAKEFLRSQRNAKPGDGQFDPVSSALYWYRRALAYHDRDGALKFLAAYAMQGGTDQKLQQALERMEPLYGMKAEQQPAFLATLSPAEAARLRNAYLFWQQMAAPSLDVSALAKERDMGAFVLGTRSAVNATIGAQLPVMQWLGQHPREAARLQREQGAAVAR